MTTTPTGTTSNTPAPTTATATTTTSDSGDGGVLLADALSVNAVSSGATGLVLLLGAPWLDGPLGVHALVLAGVGLGLVLFAELIVLTLARPAVLRRAATAVIAADLAWVAGAAVVVAGDVLTGLGDVLLGAVTVLVAGFALAQWLGLRRAGSAAVVGVRRVTLRAGREVAAPPAEAWALVAAADQYAALAPGIATTTTDGDLQAGMHRTCVDDDGRTWSETCTTVEPGRSYRMEVDTSTYPWRHRLLLHAFAMTWDVTPTATGARLELAFEGGVKLGVLGRLAMAALASDAPHEQILDAYVGRLESS